MNNTGVILEQKAGSSIPDEIIASAHKQYPSCFGYAAAQNGELLLDAGIDHKIEDVKTYLDACKEMFVDVVCHFGMNAGMKMEDAQPFVLIKDDAGKAVLAVFLEGDFAQHHEDNGHTDEANCVKNYLAPKIDMLYELVDKDIDRLMKAIMKPVTGNEIASYFGDRGCYIFLDNTGGSATVETNDKRRSFDWGSASHLEEPPPDTGTPVTTADKGSDLKARLAALKAKKNPPGVHDTTAVGKQFVTASDAERFNKAQADKKGAGKLAPIQEDMKNATALATLSDPNRLIFPNAEECRSEGTLKKFYYPNWGTCPEHWELAIGHPEKAIGMPFAKLKENSPLRKFNSLADLAGRTVAAPAEPRKNVEPSHIQEGSKVGAFPIIGGKNKQQFGELVKTVDLKSREILKPSELEEIEKKASTFFDQFGVKPEDFAYHWSEDKITQLAYNPEWRDICKLLIMSLKYRLATFYVDKKQEQPAEPAATSVPSAGQQSLKDRLAARKTARG